MTIIAIIATLAQDTAALTDWAAVGQWAFNIIFGGLVAFITYRTKKIDSLESELKAATKNQIDSQIAAVKSEMRKDTNEIHRHLESIAKRLERGEGDFKDLGERDHALRLETRAAFDELKDFIRNNCANASDVKSLEKQVAELKVAIAQRGS